MSSNSDTHAIENIFVFGCFTETPAGLSTLGVDLTSPLFTDNWGETLLLTAVEQGWTGLQLGITLLCKDQVHLNTKEEGFKLSVD